MNEFLGELFIAETRVLGLSVGNDFVILACIVTNHQYQRVTDGRTDRQLLTYCVFRSTQPPTLSGTGDG